MELKENRLVDFWWDDIRPMLSYCNNECNFTSSATVLKYCILNGSLLCFADKDLVVFGYFTYEHSKTFYITYIEGKNSKKSLGNFLGLLRGYGCSYVYSYATEKLDRWYKIIGSSINWRIVKSGWHLEVDLTKIKYIDTVPKLNVLKLRNDLLDLWLPKSLIGYTETEMSLLRQLIVNNRTSCYMINGELIIGKFEITTLRAEYQLIYTRVNNIVGNLGRLMDYLKNNEKCRYLTFDCNERLKSIAISKLNKLGGLIHKQKYFKFYHEG